MKTPICYFCAKSGVLCPRCQEKLDKGEITQADVEVSKWFIDHEVKNPQLKDYSILRTVKLPNMVIVMVSGGGNKALLSKVSKQLSDEKRTSVRIVEKTSSIKRLLEQIVTPARVMGANTVWLPDGSWESTIKMPKSDMRKMPIDPRSAEEAIRILTGEVIHIVFD
ncbi:MAG: transcription elongation factor NusA [Candidatus Verstraetearchaeota archaeon]|nr:transcription elongation factor NusA [Candidatus Verstraetearchaeota archaeon]